MKFKNVYYTILGENSSVAMIKDSFFLIERFKKGQNQFTKAFFVSNSDSIAMNPFSKEITPQVEKTVIEKMKKMPVYFDKLIFNEENNKYCVLGELLNEKLINIDSNNILCQQWGKYKFYINQRLAKEIYIENIESKSVSKQELLYGFQDVRAFFLFDIHGGTNPEIIFFLDSPFVREEKGVSIQVFQIQEL